MRHPPPRCSEAELALRGQAVALQSPYVRRGPASGPLKKERKIVAFFNGLFISEMASYTVAVVNIAKQVGKPALLVLPLLKRYDPGDVLDLRALAFIGMPRAGAVSRKVLQDVTGPDFQKLLGG